jgi:hypothetical protein
MTIDEPTPGELFRRLDALDRRIEQLAESVAHLPSSDLVATQQGRIIDRVDQVERDVAKLTALVEALTLALGTERDTRNAAISAEEKARREQVEAEARTRNTQLADEKARLGRWFRWAVSFGGLSAGGVVLQLLGWRPGG